MQLDSEERVRVYIFIWIMGNAKPMHTYADNLSPRAGLGFVELMKAVTCQDVQSIASVPCCGSSRLKGS